MQPQVLVVFRHGLAGLGDLVASACIRMIHKEEAYLDLSQVNLDGTSMMLLHGDSLIVQVLLYVSVVERG